MTPVNMTPVDFKPLTLSEDCDSFRRNVYIIPLNSGKITRILIRKLVLVRLDVIGGISVWLGYAAVDVL